MPLLPLYAFHVRLDSKQKEKKTNSSVLKKMPYVRLMSGECNRHFLYYPGIQKNI